MQVPDTVRTFNKYVLNPVMLLLAGHRYWYAGVIEHTGRRSGNKYATPVVADRVSDGFIIPLPYGTQVDWLQNVLATPQATLRVHGQTYAVDRPQVIDAARAATQLSAGRARTFGRFGIQHFVKLDALPRA